jgi:hypothetical protein
VLNVLNSIAEKTCSSEADLNLHLELYFSKIRAPQPPRTLSCGHLSSDRPLFNLDRNDTASSDNNERDMIVTCSLDVLMPSCRQLTCLFIKIHVPCPMSYGDTAIRCFCLQLDIIGLVGNISIHSQFVYSLSLSDAPLKMRLPSLYLCFIS